MHDPTPNLSPRKSPRQSRSRDTVSTLLDAAARVLATDSLVGFNTNRVAEVAGVSVGSLYQYFPNKAALIGALIDRTQDELASRIESTVRDLEQRALGLDESLAALADLAVQQQYQEPLLAAALDHEEKRLPLQARLDGPAARMVAAVQALIDRHRAALPDDLPTSAARDCLAITKALVEADVQLLGERSSQAPEGLSRRVSRALRGYLGVVPPAPTTA